MNSRDDAWSLTLTHIVQLAVLGLSVSPHYVPLVLPARVAVVPHVIHWIVWKKLALLP